VTNPGLHISEHETWRKLAEAATPKPLTFSLATDEIEAFIRYSSPDRVLALLDDLATLRAEKDDAITEAALIQPVLQRLEARAEAAEASRDALTAQVAALTNMLRRFEWLATNDGALECAACGQTPHQDHTADCSLRAVLSADAPQEGKP